MTRKPPAKRKAKLTETEKEQLAMSDAAYNMKGKAKELLKLTDWKKKRSFGDKETSVFEKGKRVVVAFRGTDNKKDFVTDIAAVALGGHNTALNERMLASLQTFKKIKKAYRGYDIQVTGHSLGGTIAQYVGRVHNLAGTSFNPGSTPLPGMRSIMERTAKTNAHGLGKEPRRNVSIINIAEPEKVLKSDVISLNAEKNFPHSPVKKLPAENTWNIKEHHGLSNFYKYI